MDVNRSHDGHNKYTIPDFIINHPRDNQKSRNDPDNNTRGHIHVKENIIANKNKKVGNSPEVGEQLCVTAGASNCGHYILRCGLSEGDVHYTKVSNKVHSQFSLQLFVNLTHELLCKEASSSLGEHFTQLSVIQVVEVILEFCQKLVGQVAGGGG
jgi:hypothetical protein